MDFENKPRLVDDSFWAYSATTGKKVMPLLDSQGTSDITILKLDSGLTDAFSLQLHCLNLNHYCLNLVIFKFS